MSTDVDGKPIMATAEPLKREFADAWRKYFSEKSDLALGLPKP
jgi:hypothetical protein